MRKGVSAHACNPIPAAQYLRMSDDSQQHSIDNQKAAIEGYAKRHGFMILQTYADLGKSGLALSCRPGLRSLLHDVVGGNIPYRAILVYDVSRWGRFQDTDESAHYEFLCKKSGAPVHYCSETFPNDETLASSVVKNLRRAMAAEYSRELSAKCFSGQKHLAELGFRVGGQAGYGLRRMMISVSGKQKKVLDGGEYKSLTTDRIVLVPGPKEEVDCVRAIFEMVLLKHLGPSQIARELNERCIPYRHGKQWKHYAVHNILCNAKYTGCNIWNRTSRRLQGADIRNPQEQWVMRANAFLPIIDQHTYDRVQRFLRRQSRWSDKELIRKLHALCAKNGRITEKLVKDTPGMPSIATYHRRLGCFRHIYSLVGYDTPLSTFDRSDQRICTYALRDAIIDTLKARFPQTLAVFHLPGKRRPILRLNTGLAVSVLVCRKRRTGSQTLEWVLNPVPAEQENVALICLANSRTGQPYVFYLVPRVLSGSRQYLSPGCRLLRSGTRLDRLSDLYHAATCFAHRKTNVTLNAEGICLSRL